MNTKHLIKKANSGEISDREVQCVYEALINDDEEAYDLLLIIGRANALKYRPLVEEYLKFEDDPMLARLSLQILCRYWGLASEYIKELCDFIAGVDWDEDEDVRDMAISCASEVFKVEKNPQLVKHIYDVFNNVEEDLLSRGAAYESLAILKGISASELPQPMHFNIDSDVTPSVIENAELILKQNHLFWEE